MKFIVEKDIFDKIPNACFGVVAAKGIDNTADRPEISALLDEYILSAAQRFDGKRVKDEPDILPYREAFRALGINPNKYMCSIEALFSRISKEKGMPHINPIVDLGNAISLKYTLPIGAHDLREVPESICVRFSCSGDTFLPFGSDSEETVEPGEAVYAAGNQIRTRRWTWRQSEHGKITAETSHVFFPIDGFSDFNKDRVIAARDQLAGLLKEVFGCSTVTGLVDIDHPEMEF